MIRFQITTEESGMLEFRITLSPLKDLSYCAGNSGTNVEKIRTIVSRDFN